MLTKKKNHAAYIAKCKGRALDGAWSAVREKKRAPADQLIGARRLVLFTKTLLVVFFFFFFLHKENKRRMTISLF